MEEKLEIISLNNENIAKEHICCCIGNDKDNKRRAETKKEWLLREFPEGLVFKKFNVRGKVFIEYLPIENAWSPVEGENYNFINCLWVAGKYQGQGLGKQLLDECIKDSKGKNGITVISTNKKRPFFTDKKFYQKYGFETCDNAPPFFELLVKKLKNNAPSPKFKDNAKKLTIETDKNIVILHSNQCPFMNDYADVMIGVAKKLNLSYEKRKIETKENAQKLTSSFGPAAVFYNGKFLTYEIMTEKKFEELLKKTMS